MSLLALVILFVLLLVLVDRWRQYRLRKEWASTYGRAGKRVLFVYSNSPNWQSYIDSELLPRLEPRVVVMNWSERSRLRESRPLEWRVFERFRPERGFNPLAIVLPESGRVHTVSFFQPFRDFKHGKRHTLQAAERRLFQLLGDRVTEQA